MPTIERQIDALGGTHNDPRYGEGYDAALEGALGVAADADALVEELLECIEDVLTGVPIAAWANGAQVLIDRVKRRRAL